MKTIEERAKEYSEQFMMNNSARENAYLQGAIEQRAIDIDKACDLMIEAFNTGKIMTTDVGKLNMWLREKLK